MSELFKRLARLTRAHLTDLFEQHWPGRSTATTWDTDFISQDDATTGPHATPPPFETSTNHGLPYSAELAEAYRALDLSYGTPLEQVAKRWKDYLKKCHPDRYANDPHKLADATRLTQELTSAYEKIKGAWEKHRV
jgi:hypothetical protein